MKKSNLLIGYIICGLIDIGWLIFEILVRKNIACIIISILIIPFVIWGIITNIKQIKYEKKSKN